MWRKLRTVPAAATLLLLAVSLPGQVVLDADERLSLDGDPVQAPVTFFLKVGDPPVLRFPPNPRDFEGIVSWQVQVFDRSGQRKLSFVQGAGRPKSPWIPWSGFDTEGRALPDGFYRAQFVWQDEAQGLHKTPPISVSILTPPGLRALYDLDVPFARTPRGLVVRIPDLLLFESGKHELKEEGLPALRRLVRFLKDSPGNKAAIDGHSDSTGSARHNLRLSYRRADRVRRFLVENGIDPRRLSCEGKGSSEPIASDVAEEGRAKNRRVDVHILRST